MINILKKSKIVLTLIIVLQLAFLCYYFNKKNDFFIDELYSYTLANSKEGEIFAPFGGDATLSANYWNRWLDGTFFRNYLTVEKNNTFNYRNIYKNLEHEIHPPLYFYLLHTVCSFFPNDFSKWFGLSINLLFFLFIEILIYLIIKQVSLSEKWALFTCIIFGFSGAAINNCLLIRSYTLLTAFFLLLLYAFLRTVENNNFDIKNILFIFITIIFGSFIHYHFFVYAFFMTIVSIIIMLKDKNYRLFAGISIASLLGVITSFLCFPLAYNGLFSSTRASETFDTYFRLLPAFSGMGFIIEMFTGIPIEKSVNISYFLLLLFIITSLLFILKRFFKEYDLKKMIIITIPTIIFIWFITPTLNYMILGTRTIRFFFAITPIIAIIITLILQRINNKYLTIILLLLTLYSSQGYKYFLFAENGNLNNFKEIVKGNNFIVFCANNELVQKMSYLLLDSNKVYLAKYDQKIIFPNQDSYPKIGRHFLIVPLYSQKEFSLPKIMQITFSGEQADVYEIPENL